MQPNYRSNLPVRPWRIALLPLNDKGYPVPWFVEWINGKPDFRVMDAVKWRSAVQHNWCWICGGPMGAYKTFVAGPMCGVNRTSSEPPAHHDCATYAAMACPFLTLPKAVRREANMPTGVGEVAGVGIMRNPGVAMLWTCRDYRVYRVPNGVLIEMGEPTRVEWFAEGRRATRAEVDESVRTGLPLLEKMAEEEGSRAVAQLRTYVERFQPHLPVAP